MSSPNRARQVWRSIAFSLAPFAIVRILALINWTTIYFTAPIFAPFLAYSTDPAFGRNTIFRNSFVALSTFVAFSLAVGLTTSWLSRSKSTIASVMLFFGVVIAFSAISHFALWLAGFTFYMETP